VRSWIHDPLWVLASFGAVWGLLVFARASRAWSADARRRFLHVGVGSWVLAVTPRFDHLAWALVPPVAFVAINASRLLRDAFPDLGDRPAAARGLWTFPLGVVATYLLFWGGESRAAVLAGIAALTFGDPAAAWVGRRWGQRRYAGFGAGRSLEGSLAFLAVACVAVGAIAAYGSPDLHALRFAVGCGAAGAAVEAVTPAGWDNVSIPIVVAGVYGMLA
jgi:dolichol kinase